MSDDVSLQVLDLLEAMGRRLREHGNVVGFGLLPPEQPNVW